MKAHESMLWLWLSKMIMILLRCSGGRLGTKAVILDSDLTYMWQWMQPCGRPSDVATYTQGTRGGRTVWPTNIRVWV